MVATRNEFITKDDLEKSLGKIKEEIIHEFQIVIEGLNDHMKVLAEGHSGLVERLDRVETRLDGMETRFDPTESDQLGIIQRFDHVETRLDRMEKEKERQYIETGHGEVSNLILNLNLNLLRFLTSLQGTNHSFDGPGQKISDKRF